MDLELVQCTIISDTWMITIVRKISTRLAILLGILILVSLACQSINPVAAPATPSPVPDLYTGRYEISGINPDRTSYTGHLTIQKVEQGYQLTWSIGEQLYTGTGTLVGDLLTVSWRGTNGDGQSVYTRDDQGVLTGTWTVTGQPGAGEETLTPKQ